MRCVKFCGAAGFFIGGKSGAREQVEGGEDDGQVLVVVIVPVAQVAAVEDLRAVEQVGVAFLPCLQAFEKGGEFLKLREFEVHQLLEFVLAPDVVGEVVRPPAYR